MPLHEYIPALSPQALVGILVFGLTLKIIGFTIRDELALRLLVATGLVCDVMFYLLREEPIVMSVAANVLLVTINVILILLIVYERTTWRMSAEDRKLYRYFHTLTPGQFRRLRRTMRIAQAESGEQLAKELQAVPDLMLVFAKEIVIAKSGDKFPIAGPAFVGEIAFLTCEPSSADVSLPNGGEVVRINIVQLRALMSRSPALNNAMIALFGQELARKVAYSVPLERAAVAAHLPAEGRPTVTSVAVADIPAQTSR